MAPKLYVVFYRPRYGNYQHWALYLESETENIIFEVIGQHPNFQRNAVSAVPENSRSFISKLYVGVIGKNDVQGVRDAAKTVKVDNETMDWDCQDYVLEILDKLEAEFILRKMTRTIVRRGRS